MITIYNFEELGSALAAKEFRAAAERAKQKARANFKTGPATEKLARLAREIKDNARK